MDQTTVLPTEPVDQTTVLPICITTQCQCQQSEVCPSCSASTIQASVITAIVTAIVTALLVTVVFVVVLAVCKFHPKLKSGKAGVSAGEVYEEVGGDEGGVAVLGGEEVSDPTYIEVGEGGGKTFQLKENEAYGTRR